jgi:hypothetical protein
MGDFFALLPVATTYWAIGERAHIALRKTAKWRLKHGLLHRERYAFMQDDDIKSFS